jgi:hypothetical protein
VGAGEVVVTPVEGPVDGPDVGLDSVWDDRLKVELVAGEEEGTLIAVNPMNRTSRVRVAGVGYTQCGEVERRWGTCWVYRRDG